MPNVSLDEIEKTARAALSAHGADDWIAAHVANAIRVAEAQGNRICGLYYLESYCQQLVSGRVKGNVDPIVTKPRPGLVNVDAQFGFAQPAFAKGLGQACDAARDCGVATLAIRHAHTCTSLGYFTHQIASAGFIGMGFTNATAVVAAPGGKNRILGTNPMAFHVPGRDGVAFGFDQSTSAIALGKITMANAAGQPIPLGWAVDANGQPTTDAAAALKGALVSTGGYKGWGLGLMVEVLASALTDTVASFQSEPLKAPQGNPHNLGQTYLLLDPTGFAGAAFHDRIDALKAEVGKEDGTRLPGSIAKMADPVELGDDIWALTQSLANGPS
ncbi:MAG: Ldh family oxidoreductase [Pseudomonadota bacterium]